MKQISNSTKRIIVLALAGLLALLMVVVVVLTSCEKRQSANQPTDASTETTQETVQNTIQETTEETEPVVLYRHPLTGAPLDAPWSGQVVAVMMNNLKKAMPQKGVGSVDILYEIEVEGDITRCLAVYTDLDKVADIGPIRSA